MLHWKACLGLVEKIAFDKFHVTASTLVRAADKVRCQEHKALMAMRTLKVSQYDWLCNPENMTRRQKLRFKALRDSTLKTARAWAIKRVCHGHYASKTMPARKGWERWLS